MHPELELLIRFTHGEGDLGEYRGVRLHLANCQECRLEAALLLRAVCHSRPGAPPLVDTLGRIRRWEAERWQEVRGDREVAFLGRAAAPRLVSHVVDRAIMRI